MGQKFVLISAGAILLLSVAVFAKGGPSWQGSAQAGQSSAAASQGAPAQAAPQDENAQKAKGLLNQMIQALGGQAWLNMQDMREQGRTWSIYHDQPTGTAQFWLFWKYPDKERIELTKKRDWIIIYTRRWRIICAAANTRCRGCCGNG
jgi:hypothetical protein